MRWVIGDIHGMHRPLRALLDEIGRRDSAARFLFVGDYVNRGPDSRQVLELLLELNQTGDARFVRGNHDDIFDMVLTGQCYAFQPQAGDPAFAFTWFTNHGLVNTLESYGVDPLDIEWVRRHPTEAAVLKLFSTVPRSHRQFIHDLPPVIDEPDLFVLHAMWDPDELDDPATIAARLASDPSARHRILWGRFGSEVSRRKRWSRTGYFGHTPVDAFPPSLHRNRNEPIFLPGVVLLDTGAALGPAGRLSAVCAETGETLQMDRNGSPLDRA